LNGLNGEAGNEDNVITIRELITYVENELPNVTLKYKQREQFPVVHSTGMDFPLILLN